MKSKKIELKLNKMRIAKFDNLSNIKGGTGNENRDIFTNPIPNGGEGNFFGSVFSCEPEVDTSSFTQPGEGQNETGF